MPPSIHLVSIIEIGTKQYHQQYEKETNELGAWDVFNAFIKHTGVKSGTDMTNKDVE